MSQEGKNKSVQRQGIKRSSTLERLKSVLKSVDKTDTTLHTHKQGPTTSNRANTENRLVHVHMNSTHSHQTGRYIHQI
jgi:hypothetical protein